MPYERWVAGDTAEATTAIVAGMDAGRAERHLSARMRPHVYARLLWWEDGARGHYPDCPCGRCAWHTPAVPETRGDE